MSAKDKLQLALNAAQKNGIPIKPGGAAFDWTGPDKEKPLYCSGFGALILFYNLRDFPNLDGGIAREGWFKALADHLGVNGWWLWRFYCGFEIGQIVYVKTDKNTKTNICVTDEKGKKIYLKPDELSKEFIKMRKKYNR